MKAQTPFAVRIALDGAKEALIPAEEDAHRDWESHIQSLFSQGRQGVLTLAKAVFAAKEALRRRGQWSALWASGRMPFKLRKGEMLAVIGQRLGQLNPQTFACFPPGWSVIYHLARLDCSILTQLVSAGSIHPEMTLQDAKTLVSEVRGRRPSPGQLRARQRLAAFGQYVHANLANWTPEDRVFFAAGLSTLIRQIESITPMPQATWAPIQSPTQALLVMPIQATVAF